MANFREDLAFSLAQKHMPLWNACYTVAFPGATTALETDLAAQRAGVDRLITMPNQQVYTVDEKIRRKIYPDILLEVWSDRDRKTPGWVSKPIVATYLAYAWVGKYEVLLLPFADVQRAWQQHDDEWLAQYRQVESHNTPDRGAPYTTVSCAVPQGVLLKACQSVQRINVFAARKVAEMMPCIACKTPKATNLFSYCASCWLVYRQHAWKRRDPVLLV